MKKLILFLLLLPMVMTAFGQQNDRTRFGFKGKVESAEIDIHGGSFNFNEEGGLNGDFRDYVFFAKKTIWCDIVKRTKNGFVATCSDFGNFTVTVKSNRIIKIVYDHLIDGQIIIRTYSYDKHGNLTNINEVFTYYTEEGIEYGSNISGVDAYNAELQKLQKEYTSMLMRGTSQAEAMAWYSRAQTRLRNKMNGISVNGYARTKRTKHTKKSKMSFSNYKFDDFGNWISRNYVLGDESGQQTQTIKYESLFWSEFYWNKLEKEGNLRKIEAFAIHPNCHETFKKKAIEYWNNHILTEVEQKDNNHIDSLCGIAKSPIVTDTIKEAALDIVRNNIYADKVTPLRDYAKVLNMEDYEYDDIAIFDNTYKKKIKDLSNSLRADSIKFLTNKANKEFESKDYSSVIQTTKGMLLIDDSNSFALNLCQEANYQQILDKEKNSSITEKDYRDFVEYYSYSPHVGEIQNKRALYASSLFDRSTSNEELERVVSLPTDDSTHKVVEKRYKKWMFKNNHGRFFHVGLGGEIAAGGANSVAGGELSMRFGYHASLLNLTVGIKYNYLSCTSQLFKQPKESGNAYFDKHYLSVPVMLRFNVKHGFKGSTYIGAGTELNVSTLSANLRDVENLKDKEFASSGFSMSPRISFGGTILGIELELFACYDIDNPFNADYIEKYRLESGKSIKSSCDSDAYEKQVNAEKFLDKVRGGLAIRFWF